ncbi:immunity 22 family protein [Microbacterium sp. ZW T5_56]|uniref:immunity 22 family protein n=1 Tax=Microbacterium sp. ZW T5_56 TaxID=3378081 RepID=UPI003854D9F3
MHAKRSYSEEFRRALVREALTNTPTGGFPELEKREGLRAGTLFDWVEEFGPTWEAPFSSLHFWIGPTALTEDEFWRYFDHAEDYWDLEVEDVEAAESDVTGCGFCIDTGMKFLYDEDLLQVIWFDELVPVRTVIDESTIDAGAPTDAVVEACEARGMTTANAAFVYADPAFVAPDTTRLFNGLPYLGKFRAKDDD